MYLQECPVCTLHVILQKTGWEIQKHCCTELLLWDTLQHSTKCTHQTVHAICSNVALKIRWIGTKRRKLNKMHPARQRRICGSCLQVESEHMDGESWVVLMNTVQSAKGIIGSEQIHTVTFSLGRGLRSQEPFWNISIYYFV